MAKIRTPKEIELAKLRADFLKAADLHPYQSCTLKFSDGYVGKTKEKKYSVGNLRAYRIDADKRQVVFEIYGSDGLNGTPQTLPENIKVRGIEYEIIVNKVPKPNYAQERKDYEAKKAGIRTKLPVESPLEKKVESPPTEEITSNHHLKRKERRENERPSNSRR